MSGLALSPLIVGNVPGAVISGRVMMYARHYKMLPLATMPFAVLAMLVPVIWPHAPLWLVLTSMATVASRHKLSDFHRGVAAGGGA